MWIMMNIHRTDTKFYCMSNFRWKLKEERKEEEKKDKEKRRQSERNKEQQQHQINKK